MIEGIDILNETKILGTPLWCDILGPITLVCIFACFIVMLLSIGFECKKAAIVSIIGLVVSVVLLILAILFSDSIDTGRYRYEVTIDDAVSFNKLCEKYNVIEQKGKIWTIEDKEK